MQNKGKVIGITGGIGSGKSAVSKIILKMGFPVVDADVISRHILEKGSDAYFQVINEFGPRVLLEDGEIDRKRLGEIIFNDESERLKLNRIVHPAVYKEINNRIEAYSALHRLVFVDVPLLFENGRMSEYDEVWVVYAGEDIRVKRICDRDEVDEAYAKVKINAQMPLDKKVDLATRVIMNEDTIEDLENRVIQHVNSIIK